MGAQTAEANDNAARLKAQQKKALKAVALQCIPMFSRRERCSVWPLTADAATDVLP